MNNRIPLYALSYSLGIKKNKQKKQNAKTCKQFILTWAAWLWGFLLHLPLRPSSNKQKQQRGSNVFKVTVSTESLLLLTSHNWCETVHCSRCDRGQQPWARGPMSGTQKQKHGLAAKKKRQTLTVFPHLTVKRQGVWGSGSSSKVLKMAGTEMTRATALNSVFLVKTSIFGLEHNLFHVSEGCAWICDACPKQWYSQISLKQLRGSGEVIQLDSLICTAG